MNSDLDFKIYEEEYLEKGYFLVKNLFEAGQISAL